MIGQLWRRFFYNPYSFVTKCAYATIGNSKLAKSFSLEFRVPRTASAFAAGDNCILMHKNVFESDAGFIRIGSGTFINAGTSLISRESISIGNDVTIAWGCTIYDHDSHSLDYKERIRDQQSQLNDWDTGSFIQSKNWSSVRSGAIKIEDFAWLGFDVVVLKGVTIGKGAIIGARSVVSSDIPPWTVAVGNPAKVVKELPRGLRHD